MPTYQYACTNAECGNRFELVQSFTDPSASECPVCGSPVRKVYGSVGVVFKGSGFYRNDSRDSGGGKRGSDSTTAKDSGGSGSNSGSKESSTSGGDKSSATESGGSGSGKDAGSGSTSSSSSTSSSGSSGSQSGAATTKAS